MIGLTLRILGYLPLTIRRYIGRGVGRVFALFPTRERRIAELQIASRLPELPARRVAKRVFIHVGEVLLESLNLSPILSTPEMIDFARWDELHREHASGHGAIALSAHLGNWELLAATCAAHGFQVNAIGRPARGTGLQEILAEIRSRFGVRTLWRQNAAGLKDIVRIVREGGIIAALIDQDTRVTSEFSEFFGNPAKTPTALIHLGLREKVPFYSAFIVKNADGRYELSFQRLNGTTPAEILSQYHANLEERIRAYPEQWVWFHKRWRTAPGIPTRSTAEYIAELEREVHATRSHSALP